MKILITGAAGFIGNHVARELTQRGHRVHAVDDDPTRRCELGDPVRTDCADRILLHKVRSAEFDAVVHLAAIVDTTTTDRERMRTVNTEKALALAHASSKGSATFVYASSASVYGLIERGTYVREEDVGTEVSSGPLNVYAESKLLLDTAMSNEFSRAAWSWVGLRFTNVFGPGEEHKGRMASYLHQMLRRTASGRPITLFQDTLEAARDWVPVATVAARVARIVESPPPAGLYNMGSGLPISFGTLIDWCASFAGMKPVLELVANPYASAYQYWTAVDMSRWLDASDTRSFRLRETDVHEAARQLFEMFPRAAGHRRESGASDEAPLRASRPSRIRAGRNRGRPRP
jgi:ADP-L-glycero-D-manno-heptose 6-epimerase